MAKPVKKCKHCKKSYRGTSTSKFCGNRCRQADYRCRKNPDLKTRTRSSEKATLVITCNHCGKGFWAKTSVACYCSASCRVRAYRVRRETAIITLALHTGLPSYKANDVVDTFGLKHVASLLKRYGYKYNSLKRVWETQRYNEIIPRLTA